MVFIFTFVQVLDTTILCTTEGSDRRYRRKTGQPCETLVPFDGMPTPTKVAYRQLLTYRCADQGCNIAHVFLATVVTAEWKA